MVNDVCGDDLDDLLGEPRVGKLSGIACGGRNLLRRQDDTVLPDQSGKLFTVKGREVLTINTSVNDILSLVFDLHPNQVVNGPAWLASDKFDITGKPEAPGLPRVPPMKAILTLGWCSSSESRGGS